MQMANLSDLEAALEPILEHLAAFDVSKNDAAASLEARFPFEGESVQAIRVLVREGVEAGWLAPREDRGIRFGRLRKAANPNDLSVDCVHMNKPGPGHTHPNGEVDLCFRVDEAPTFDGHPEGWVVYPPNSWHVPTVADGVMDILYFLPGGAIRFEPKPSS
jgi:hypothetical protein